MSNSGAIKAGRAYVELFADENPLIRGLKSAEARVMAFSRTAGALGRGMFAIGAGITAAFIPAITAASNMQETMAKFRQTFGSQADPMTAWADDFADRIHRSRLETMKSLATFQAFFRGLEFGEEKAAGLSRGLHELAVDFAAFHNIPDEEAFQRFISSLSGSVESMDQFGINMHVGALEPVVERMFGVSFKDADEGQKTLARIEVILKSMERQGAIGAAAREGGNFSSQWKALRGELENLAVTVGTVLLPVISQWIALAVQGVQALTAFVATHEGLVKGIFEFGAFLVGIGGVLIGLATAGQIAAGIMAGLALLATPMGALLAAILALTAAATAAAVVLGMEDAQQESEFRNKLPQGNDAPTNPNPDKSKGPNLGMPTIDELKQLLAGVGLGELPKFPRLADLAKIEQQYAAPGGTFSENAARMFFDRDPNLEVNKGILKAVQEQLKLSAEEVRILKTFEPGMAVAP